MRLLQGGLGRRHLSTCIVVQTIEHLVQREKCGVVFVDYLQNLILPVSGNYHHAISRAAKRLRMTCARLGVPLILGSQLKRLEEGVEPQLTHLKESGDIENLAKVVLLLWNQGRGPSPRVLGKIAKCSAPHSGQAFTVTRGESGAFAEIEGR